jgi:hypothetical protein
MALRLERRLAATAVAVVVASIGAGTAAACDHDGSQKTGVLAARYAMHTKQHHAKHHHGWKHHRGSLLALPAAYLGISTDALKDQLRSGKTLAQVANATPGRSAPGLVAYLVDKAKVKLDAKVAAGKLTQAQENDWLAKLTTWVTAAVNGTLHH